MQVQTPKGLFSIREALSADLPEIVAIHIASFNATYPDYTPKPGYPFREQQWKKAFLERKDNWFCFVAQHTEGPIVGFATGHDFHDPALLFKGQLDKIHLLKPCQRLGLGSLLVSQVALRFLENGIRSMVLFADPENPAIRFYDALKGERLRDSQQQFTGAFGWRDLDALVDFLRKRQQGVFIT